MKKVLLNWGYYRKDWVKPFNDLGDEVELIFLYYNNSLEDPVNDFPFRRIYYTEFSNSADLLNSIKPELVIFMSIDSGLNILLNLEARKRKLKTVILQHGLTTTYRDYRLREKNNSISLVVSPTSSGARVSIKSWFKLQLNQFCFTDLLKLPIYFYVQRKKGKKFALYHFCLKASRPTEYWCYSKKNSVLEKELYGAKESEIRYLGIPEFDTYFKPQISLSKLTLAEPFFLLIDQEFVANRFGENAFFTKAEKLEFYKKLRDYAKSLGCKLVVKLHPESFNSDWFEKLDGVEWLREVANMEDYIKEARGVFGFFSTLILPAVVVNRVCLFKVSNSELQHFLKSNGLAKVVDAKALNTNDIDFVSRNNKVKELMRPFFYMMDGKARSRLHNLIINQ